MKTFKINLILMLCIVISFVAPAQDQIVSEDYNLKNDSIQLPGRLSYSNALKKQPLVIFVQGSGNPDRNGNQLGLNIKANYIKILRDSLNTKGIAFYSYDKRTATKSNIPIMIKGMAFKELADDVAIAINQFKNDKRFNSITLIGHSQGSLVAMLSINEDVDKFVSLAGIANSVDKTIIRQVSSQSAELGKTTEAHFKELKETGTIENVNPMLLSIFSKQNLDFLKSYMLFNPASEIKRLNLPILIINGTKDIQVTVEDAKALHEANPNSKLRLIENMNHVLKTITKDEDNMASYYASDFPLSQELVSSISEFINNN